MHIPVSVERVYAALNSDAGRAAFWAESAVEQGGAIDFVFINGVRHQAAIIGRRPPDLWAITYFGAGATFTLVDDGHGGTDLTLVHDGVPPEDWADVHAGWLNVLFPLKAWLTFGVDLRNHDAQRTWDHGYADQ